MNFATNICNTCVMDSTDPNIIFYNDGTCNHCREATKKLKELKNNDSIKKELQLKEIIKNIKYSGKNNKYDCLIGLSGGVDSSYLAWITKELGLRPLAIHIDNGWNTELAVKNIENIVNKLNIDLKTIVLDWEEFKSLQRAFLKASVVDLEMLSDNAIIVGIKRTIKKEKIKYFLSGTNAAAESIMPHSWYYSLKYDSLNIRSIYNKFSDGKPLKNYPLLNIFEFIAHKHFNSLLEIPLLDYVPYIKENAIKVLEKELNWVNYGGKHYESKITQFYQAYILPTKFNIDKRKAHLSSLICSGQITRDEALAILNEPLYNYESLESDKQYFCKKLGLTLEEFNNIMALPIKKHTDYKSYQNVYNKLSKLKRLLIPKNEED